MDNFRNMYFLFILDSTIKIITVYTRNFYGNSEISLRLAMFKTDM